MIFFFLCDIVYERGHLFFVGEACDVEFIAHGSFKDLWHAFMHDDVFVIFLLDLCICILVRVDVTFTNMDTVIDWVFVDDCLFMHTHACIYHEDIRVLGIVDHI